MALVRSSLSASWRFRRPTSPTSAQLRRLWLRLSSLPERTAWVDFYTDDAIFVGAGVPAIEGRTALLDIAPQISISSMEIVAESTLGTDEFAATLGRVTWVSGPNGSDAPRVRRRFLMVWRREPDGRWRIARELLNEDV